jgi:hypothetical protein
MVGFSPALRQSEGGGWMHCREFLPGSVDGVLSLINVFYNTITAKLRSLYILASFLIDTLIVSTWLGLHVSQRIWILVHCSYYCDP